MTDATCFDLILNLAIFIGLLVFYRTVMSGAQAMIVLACDTDHGHKQAHDLPCECKCHRVAKA